jgi:hypothetical protein
MKIGDRIRFRAVTRWTDKPAVRQIRGFDHHDRPLVRFGGWSDFIVERSEILHHLPASAAR